jgi:stringent starvation protein B
MLSNRPYLLRAFYEWIVDSQCTPILVIDANHPRIRAPMEFAESGEIVFNVSTSAVRDLKMANESVEFKASFSGVIHIIYAPVGAILAVYAEENGEGIFFDAEDDEITAPEGLVALKGLENTGSRMKEADLASPEAINTKAKVKPFLKLVE